MSDGPSNPRAVRKTAEAGTAVPPPFNRTFVVAGTTAVQATMSLAVLMLAAVAPAVAEAILMAWLPEKSVTYVVPASLDASIFVTVTV